MGVLLIRVALGVVFLAHGAQKMLGWFGGQGIAGTMQYLNGYLKIPKPLAYIGAFTEFFGSIAPALGLFTKLAALGLCIMMLVAMFKVHWKVGFFMNWGGEANRGEGYDFTLTLALALLSLLIAGGGPYSLDAMFR